MKIFIKERHQLYILYLCSNGIQFVNEDDRRSFLFSQSEGVPHHLCPVTNEHLHQLRSSQLQKCALQMKKKVVATDEIHNCLCEWVHLFEQHRLWPVESFQYLEPHIIVHLKTIKKIFFFVKMISRRVIFAPLGG